MRLKRGGGVVVGVSLVAALGLVVLATKRGPEELPVASGVLQPIPTPQVLAAPIEPGELHGKQAGDSVSEVAFSRDGRLLAGSGTTGHSGSISALFLWDTKTKRLLRRWTGKWMYPEELRASPLGDLVAGRTPGDSSGGSNFIWVRDLGSGELACEIMISGSSLHSFAFAPDGRTLWTASGVGAGGVPQNRGALSLWDARSGELIRSWTVPDAAIVGAAPTRDGKYLIVNKAFSHFNAAAQGYFNRTELWLWDARRGRPLRRLFQGPDREPLITMALSPDQKQIAAVGVVQSSLVAGETTAALRVFVDVQSGRVVRREHPGSSRLALRVLYASSGRHVLVRSLGVSGALEVWDPARGELRRLDRPDVGESIATSPDGNTLAIPGKPLVRLRNVADLL